MKNVFAPKNKASILSILVTSALLQSQLAWSAALVNQVSYVDLFHLPSEQVESVCHECSPIDFKVETYSNGNSDARINETVFGKRVVLPVKREMSATEYVQLLIMIRVLKNEGADSISVRLVPGSTQPITVKSSSGEIISLNHKLNFAVAGANDMSGQGVSSHLDIAEYRQAQLHKLSRRAKVPLAYIDGNVHPDLGVKLSEALSLPPVSQLGTEPKGKSIFLVYSQVEGVNDTLLQTLAKAHSYFKHGNEVHLISPYMPYARGDKADKKGITAPLALMADLFIQSGVSSVHFVRPHAAQGRLAYSSIIVRETSSYDTIAKAIADESVDIIISPDAGAQKEATVFADKVTDGEVAVINKQRKGNTIEIRGISISEAFKQDNGEISLEGKTVLILDDESASGSTLAEAAELLKSKFKASRVIAAFTHLTGDAAKAIKSPYLDRIIVTDTIPVKTSNPRMSVVSIADELSQLIAPLVASRNRCLTTLNGGQP